MLQPHLVSQCYQWCYQSCHNTSCKPGVTVLPVMLLLLSQCFNRTWCHSATSDVITLVTMLQPHLVSQCYQWCYYSCHNALTAPGVTVLPVMLLLLSQCFNNTWCHSATSDVITLVTMLQPHLVSQCYQRCYHSCHNASTTPGVTVLPAMLLRLSQCFNHTWCHSATSDVITLVTMLQPHLVSQCYQWYYYSGLITLLQPHLLLLCFNHTWCHSATGDVITLVTMLQPHLVSQCYQRCYPPCDNASTTPGVTVLPAMLLLLSQCFNRTWCHSATSDVITLVTMLQPHLVSSCYQWCYHSCRDTSTATGVTVLPVMLSLMSHYFHRTWCHSATTDANNVVAILLLKLCNVVTCCSRFHDGVSCVVPCVYISKRRRVNLMKFDYRRMTNAARCRHCIASAPEQPFEDVFEPSSLDM